MKKNIDSKPSRGDRGRCIMRWKTRNMHRSKEIQVYRRASIAPTDANAPTAVTHSLSSYGGVGHLGC